MSRRFVYYGAGVAAADLLLDLYPSNGSQCYMNKVSSTYTGACIRVRRSSDNAEMDIGFVGVDLDTTSLLSFVGAGDGYVTTWYSQSGFYDLTQTTLTKQPVIIMSGTLQMLNSKPCIKFDGVDDVLSGGTSANNTANNMYNVCIGEMKSDNMALFAKALASGVSDRHFIIRSTDVYTRIDDDSITIEPSPSGLPNMYSNGLFYEAGVKHKMIAWLNGVNKGITDLTSTVSGNSYRFLLGAYNNTNDNGEILYNNGRLQTYGYWGGTDLQGDTTAIRDIINNYYAIY